MTVVSRVLHCMNACHLSRPNGVIESRMYTQISSQVRRPLHSYRPCYKLVRCRFMLHGMCCSVTPLRFPLPRSIGTEHCPSCGDPGKQTAVVLYNNSTGTSTGTGTRTRTCSPRTGADTNLTRQQYTFAPSGPDPLRKLYSFIYDHIQYEHSCSPWRTCRTRTSLPGTRVRVATDRWPSFDDQFKGSKGDED
jgi:hypothetical protein